MAAIGERTSIPDSSWASMLQDRATTEVAGRILSMTECSPRRQAFWIPPHGCVNWPSANDTCCVGCRQCRFAITRGPVCRSPSCVECHSTCLICVSSSTPRSIGTGGRMRGLDRRTFLGLGSLTFAGCTKESPYFGNTQPPVSQQLICATIETGDSLDPAKSGFFAEGKILQDLFEGL